MLVLDLPLLREVELVLVWTVHTLFEYAQFPLLENQSICLFKSPVLISARSALYSRLKIADFASASNCSLVFPKVILI